jgi:hypothetical protein
VCKIVWIEGTPFCDLSTSRNTSQSKFLNSDKKIKRWKFLRPTMLMMTFEFLIFVTGQCLSQKKTKSTKKKLNFKFVKLTNSALFKFRRIWNLLIKFDPLNEFWINLSSASKIFKLLILTLVSPKNLKEFSLKFQMQSDEFKLNE